MPGDGRTASEDPTAPGSRIAAVLASRAGVPAARAGDRLAVRVDLVLLDGPSAAAVLKSRDARVPVRDPFREAAGEAAHAATRVAVVAGPELPRADRRRVVEFARQNGWAIGHAPSLAGLPSVVATDEGLVGSGDVVAAIQADAGALGGLGCAAVRSEPRELAGLLSGEPLSVVVPPTRFVRVRGRLPRWVGPYDVAIAALEAAGGLPAVRGVVLEFHGETVRRMDLADRLALCGALAAAGVAAVVPPDDATGTFLAARRAAPDSSPRPAVPAPPPDDAWLDLDAGRVALAAVQLPPPGASRAALGDAPAGLLPGRRLDPCAAAGPQRAGASATRGADRPAPPAALAEVVLGGRLQDLRIAAEVLRDRNVRPGLFLAIQPASQRVLLHAIEEGLAADFLRAGASLVPPGAVLAGSGEVRVVCGAAGGAGPGDIVAGPAVAAASAVAGRLCDPEGMRRSHRRASRVG